MHRASCFYCCWNWCNCDLRACFLLFEHAQFSSPFLNTYFPQWLFSVQCWSFLLLSPLELLLHVLLHYIYTSSPRSSSCPPAWQLLLHRPGPNHLNFPSLSLSSNRSTLTVPPKYLNIFFSTSSLLSFWQSHGLDAILYSRSHYHLIKLPFQFCCCPSATNHPRHSSPFIPTCRRLFLQLSFVPSITTTLCPVKMVKIKNGNFESWDIFFIRAFIYFDPKLNYIILNVHFKYMPLSFSFILIDALFVLHLIYWVNILQEIEFGFQCETFIRVKSSVNKDHGASIISYELFISRLSARPRILPRCVTVFLQEPGTGKQKHNTCTQCSSY